MKQFTFSNFLEKEEEAINVPDGFVYVTFLKAVPQFVGVDLKVYGSFCIGETSMIPKLNSIGLKTKEACK